MPRRYISSSVLGAVLIAAVFSCATLNGEEPRHFALPPGAEELYRSGDSLDEREPIQLCLTHDCSVATILRSVKDFGKALVVIYSSKAGSRELEIQDTAIKKCSFGNRGVLIRSDLLDPDRDSVVWISIDDASRELFCKAGVVDAMYVNDAGLILVDGRESISPRARRFYYRRQPGGAIESFTSADPKAKTSLYFGGLRGDICEINAFEGKSSPVSKLRDAALKQAKADDGAEAVPPLVIPVAAFNEQYGLVYSVPGPGWLQLFTYRKSDGATAQVFDSSSEFLVSRWGRRKNTVVALADTGDMLVETFSPNMEHGLELEEGTTGLLLYRREANRLIDFNTLLPTGQTFAWYFNMNSRGDVLFTSQASDTYFLPAGSEAPRIVRSITPPPENLKGIRLGNDRKIYFWAKMDGGKWVLGRVDAAPFDATAVVLGSAGLIVIAGAWVMWRRRHAKRTAGIAVA